MRVTLLVAVALTQASAERPHEEEESFTPVMIATTRLMLEVWAIPSLLGL